MNKSFNFNKTIEMNENFNFNRTIEFNILVSYEDIKEKIFSLWNYVKRHSKNDDFNYFFNNSDVVLRWCDIRKLIRDLIDSTNYISEKDIPNYNKEFYNALNDYVVYVTPILLKEWKEELEEDGKTYEI